MRTPSWSNRRFYPLKNKNTNCVKRHMCQWRRRSYDNHWVNIILSKYNTGWDWCTENISFINSTLTAMRKNRPTSISTLSSFCCVSINFNSILQFQSQIMSFYDETYNSQILLITTSNQFELKYTCAYMGTNSDQPINHALLYGYLFILHKLSMFSLPFSCQTTK